MQLKSIKSRDLITVRADLLKHCNTHSLIIFLVAQKHGVQIKQILSIQTQNLNKNKKAQIMI